MSELEHPRGILGAALVSAERRNRERDEAIAALQRRVAELEALVVRVACEPDAETRARAARQGIPS